MNYNRDNSIDILRGGALLCIFLAHVDPNFWVFQARNFDVILMVFISGSLYKFDNTEYSVKKHCDYILKRFQRIVFPVWIFLSIFFVFCWIFELKIFSIKEYLLSFSLISGIGFVWIFRVFLSVAIILPWFVVIYNNNKVIFFAAIILFNLLEFGGKVYETLVLQSINYTLVAFVGYKIGQTSLSLKTRVSIIVTVIFLVLWIVIKDINLQDYKYPPTGYYFIYGLLVSIILTSFKICNNNLFTKYLNYLGLNSMWLYLWHIPIVLTYQGLSIPSLIQFTTLLVIPIVVYSFQEKMIKYFLKNYQFKKYLLG